MIFNYKSNEKDTFTITEVDGIKVKCELIFRGKEGEIEIFTEFNESKNSHQDKYSVAFNLASRIHSNNLTLLKFNNKIINTNYYELIKVNIMDCSTFRMKVNQYGERM